MNRVTWLVWALVVAGCAPAPATETDLAITAEDEAAIRRLIEDWGAVAADHDCAALGQYYTEDYFEAVAALREGREAAVTACEGLAFRWSSFTPTVRRIEGSGNLAYAFLGVEARYRTVEGGFLGTQSGNQIWLFRKDPVTGWRMLAWGGGSNFVRDSVPM